MNRPNCSSRSRALAFVFGLGLLGCNGNTQADRDRAQAAADAYCDCAQGMLVMAPETLAATTNLCDDANNAFKAAWESLPTRASGDDKALAISNYHHGCYQLLHDTWGTARTAHPQ